MNTNSRIGPSHFISNCFSSQEAKRLAKEESGCHFTLVLFCGVVFFPPRNVRSLRRDSRVSPPNSEGTLRLENEARDAIKFMEFYQG